MMSRRDEWLWPELRPERLVWTMGSIGLVAVMLLALMLWAREFDPRIVRPTASVSRIEAPAKAPVVPTSQHVPSHARR